MGAPSAYLGVDIGGSSVRVMGESVEGPARSGVLRTTLPASYDALVTFVLDAAGQILDGRPCFGVGVGVPGTVVGGHPRLIPAIEWLSGRPLADELPTLVGAPTRVAVDAQLTLLAEAQEGAAKSAVGAGIDGALLVDGRIWRGAHGSPGAWGWLPCSGGRYGLWEQRALALARRGAGVWS